MVRQIACTFLILFLFTSSNYSQWFKQISGTTNWLRAVSFNDSVNGIAVGENGTILRTTNGGGGVSFIEEQEIDEKPMGYLLSQNYPTRLTQVQQINIICRKLVLLHLKFMMF